MREAYLFFTVKSFSHKVRERERQPNKVYGIDQAMLRSVSLTGQKNDGRLLENIVYLELLRRNKNVLYYNDPQGKYEIDFVSSNKTGGPVELIQVCLDTQTEEVKERELRGFQNAGKVFREIASATVVTLDQSRHERIGDLEVAYIPIWKWLLI